VAPRQWTLRSLFVLLTLCGVVVFAVIRYGTLDGAVLTAGSGLAFCIGGVVANPHRRWMAACFPCLVAIYSSATVITALFCAKGEISPPFVSDIVYWLWLPLPIIVGIIMLFFAIPFRVYGLMVIGTLLVIAANSSFGFFLYLRLLEAV
jgi:hypothetical protein